MKQGIDQPLAASVDVLRALFRDPEPLTAAAIKARLGDDAALGAGLRHLIAHGAFDDEAVTS